MGDFDVAHQAKLTRTLMTSPSFRACLEALEGLQAWVGAGAIAQIVWNVAHGYPDGFGILDLDVVYFDPKPTAASEQSLIENITARLVGCPWRVDVKNQATVHEWYPTRFGHQIRPYRCLQDAVASWPTTATAVAVRARRDGVEWLAPFGLNDLDSLVVRANRVQAPQSVFHTKAARWTAAWPRLTVLAWDEGIGEPQARWQPSAGKPAADPRDNSTAATPDTTPDTRKHRSTLN